MEMGMGSVQHFVKGKTILVTGAAGFLAKVFVEKLLRIQYPDVKKLYLLLRASDTDAAAQRLHHEIIGKELFRAVRDKIGADFDSFISKKVVAVAGDVSLENLGLEDANLEKAMFEEVEVIVNFAATTNFDERFDIAMGVNTMGALHLLNFAKSCHGLLVFLHVSTAYVCGEAKGVDVIEEKPFEMGQTLSGSSKKILDIETEKSLMEKIIQQLRAQNAADGTAISSAMKDYGMKRAKLYGWPNTYVFTKAMGEMLLSHFRHNIPLIIIRPTMVTSTYKEPFPGWIEGFRTMDAVIGGYGKGKVKCFLGHSKTILDVIPADMVVNCMMAAMATHSYEASQNFIYHISSSNRNPIRIFNIRDISYLYFTKNPWIDKNEKPVIISTRGTVLESMSSFHRYMMIRFVLPLKGLNLANKLFCRSWQDVYSESRRKIKTVTKMAELYKPYAFFKAVFDDTNTEKLRMAMKKMDVGSEFEFDPKSIDWTDYMMNVHIPGLVNYVMRMR